MKAKHKSRLAKAKPRFNPYFVNLSKMTEADKARLLDDALVYLQMADARLPSRVYLAESVTESRFYELSTIGLREWMRPEETIAVLRPGFGCVLAIDYAVSKMHGVATIDVMQLNNDGTLERNRHEFKRDPLGGQMTCTKLGDPQLRFRVTPDARNHDTPVSIGSSTYRLPEAYVTMGQALQIAALRRREWTTFLSEAQASIGLITDPTAIKEMYTLREKPEGRNRRAALLHMVQGHYRKAANPDKDRIFVESHLRGAREFEWFGLRAEISPNVHT